MNKVAKSEANTLAQRTKFLASGVTPKDVLPPIHPIPQRAPASAAHTCLVHPNMFIQSEVIKFVFVKRGLLDVYMGEKH